MLLFTEPYSGTLCLVAAPDLDSPKPEQVPSDSDGTTAEGRTFYRETPSPGPTSTNLTNMGETTNVKALDE